MAFEIAKNVVSDRKVVAEAGTRVPLNATSLSIFRVDISADLGNANPIVYGGADVVAVSGSQKGAVLIPGNDVVTIFVDDLSKIYIDAQSDGDAATFTYYRHH